MYTVLGADWGEQESGSVTKPGILFYIMHMHVPWAMGSQVFMWNQSKICT